MVLGKVKSLFDHLNQIYCVQDKNYFKNLSESDLKTWSNFMLNRFISMTYDYIEYIDYIQKYSPNLKNEIYYKLLIGIFPKKKVYSKYIKSKNSSYIKDEHIDIFSKHFEISKKSAIEYINILNNIDSSKVDEILSKYGYVKDDSIKKRKKSNK